MANAADTAANFGYAVSFFQSDPELKALLNNAVKGNWTPAQFVAKLQATKWFKKNGEAARQVIALKTSDPATYKQRLATAKAQVRDLAAQVGAASSAASLGKLAENALMFGWSDAQIKDALGSYIGPDKAGIYRGSAGTAQRQIIELAGSYGIRPPATQLGGWVKGMVSGATSLESIKQALINTATSRYPALYERLRDGETLEDIAAPYKDSYSRILEVPASQITLQDPAIQQALSVKAKDGKPSTKTVWQFETDLRSDPRWLKTNNAREQLVGTTRKVLSDMGLVV